MSYCAIMWITMKIGQCTAHLVVYAGAGSCYCSVSHKCFAEHSSRKMSVYPPYVNNELQQQSEMDHMDQLWWHLCCLLLIDQQSSSVIRMYSQCGALRVLFRWMSRFTRTAGTRLGQYFSSSKQILHCLFLNGNIDSNQISQPLILKIHLGLSSLQHFDIDTCQ